MIQEHAELVLEHLDSIAVGEVRQAYLYLVLHATGLREYECRPQDKGEVRDFRYYRGGEQPFAFIVNQKSLLWYFRVPGLRHPSANVERLKALFSEVREIPRGEISARISSREDAQRMVELVFGA